jgi:hypothetical protein
MSLTPGTKLGAYEILSFSPDGRWIYLQPNQLNIYRMSADGGLLQHVTNLPEAGLFPPSL